jgi:ribosomal protein L30E
MNESSCSGLNTDNSICSKETINSSISFERDSQISEEKKKLIIKSISKNLNEIIKENIQNNQMAYVRNDFFYYNQIPEISLDDYINRIFKNTKMNISSLICAIIYIDRFCELNRYVLCMNNIHRIFLTACLLSIKFNEDINNNIKYYAQIAGIPVYDLNNLELYFFFKLKCSLYVDSDFYQNYFEYFCK